MAKTGLSVNIEVLGDKALQKALNALPITMERKIVTQALRKAAKPVLATAKARCPVKTGALRKSLKLRAIKRRKGNFGVRIMTGTRKELGIPAEYPYYYPAHVELGHAGTPAIPFLRSSLEDHRTQCLQMVALMVRAGIDKATAGPKGQVKIG